MKVLFKAKALLTPSNLSNYPDINEDDLWVEGYYVKCRGHHYILLEYNDNGFDERWETAEWVEIDDTSLLQIN